MGDELATSIAQNAQQPRKAAADGVEVEQHSLKDQIEADRYLCSKVAAKKGLKGIVRTRVIPPGAV